MEKQYRYEIHRALSHPWITRSIESSIPLNTFEKIWVNEGKMKLKLVIKLDTIKPMNFSKKNSPTNHIQEKMIKAQDTKKKNSFFLKYKSNNI